MLNFDPPFKAGFSFRNIFLLLFILDNILLYIENLYFIHVLYSLLMLSRYVVVLHS